MHRYTFLNKIRRWQYHDLLAYNRLNLYINYSRDTIQSVVIIAIDLDLVGLKGLVARLATDLYTYFQGELSSKEWLAINKSNSCLATHKAVYQSTLRPTRLMAKRK